MDLTLGFNKPPQRAFYYSTARNQCFSGGFNNGKSFGACLKAFTLLSTFPNYRIVIARQVRADLMKTTYQTFFKICPPEFVERSNEQDGLTVLKNRSRVIWMHLDKADESTLRGLETNSIIVDQAEEIEEKIYDVLDARVGRWDDAVIPEYLLKIRPDWPKNKISGKYVAPSYMMLLCNPDTQFHFIYKKYHTDSLERDSKYFFIEGEWDKELGTEETYANALKHDQEWIDKYVLGRWGISNAQIHRVWPESLLDYDPELIDRIKRKGNLYRSMDHGESAPTCCLWFAAIGGVYICYREYYAPGKVISEHRKAINDLSGDEQYSGSFADPNIFYKEAKRNAGFWSVGDEYLSKDIDRSSKPISWIPADNNEFATRNRINELLRPKEYYKHPITGKENSPGLYFVKKSEDYPNGCLQSINQLGAQRRELLGYEDGRAIYSDERNKKIADHAYDPTRYFIAMHGIGIKEEKRKIPRNSIAYYRMIEKRRRNAIPVAGSV